MAAQNRSKQAADALDALADGTFSAAPSDNPFIPKPVRKPARPAAAFHDEETMEVVVEAPGAGQGIVEMTADDDPPGESEEIDSLTSTPAPRTRSAAAMKARSNKAYAETFKRTIMPIMVAVGVLLLVFSGVTASMMGGAVDGEGGPTYFQKYGGLMLAGSIPIALIMFGGAIMFYMELRKSRQMQLMKRPKFRRGR
ncbi:MAG: hypothetical protein HZA50_06880 [Planctomycetes bacterium]|nr:hypothetical protein [Planctomycetota bacterium]